MKLINIIITFVLLLSFEAGFTQQKTKTEFSRRPEPDPKILSIKIGDRVPEILIKKIIRNNIRTAKLSDFKDQLLILDFFDTFCGSCIEALPKLDSLQKQFGNKIKILPVSYQSEQVMEAFFKNRSLVRNLHLPCVVEDKVLGSHFKYKLISHEVWIYKGIVKAITGTDYVTAKNIQTILDGNDVNWPVKNDMIDFNPTKQIFVQQLSDQYNLKNGFLNYSGITGHRDGIDYKGGIRSTYDSIGRFYRTYFYNFNIVAAFRALTFSIGSHPKNILLTPGRLFLEVKDKSRYVYDKSYGFRSDWNRENEICYEFISAKHMEEKTRLQYVFEDLCLKLGLNVGWKKRKVDCLVLKKVKEIDNLETLNQSRNKTVKNGWVIDVPGIILMYFDIDGKYPPVLNETNFKGQMIIGDDTSLNGLKEQLKLYGLELEKAEREIDVMLIQEK